MSQTINKKLCELFEPENGKSLYTKTYCREHPGPYIVYTGTTIGVFGSIDKADYTCPHLTFTTDGENAGTIEYIKDDGYCIGGHRTILKPIVDGLDLLYFKYVMQPVFFCNVKRGDVPSLHFSHIKDLEIAVPILSDGSFDIEAQKTFALKCRDIEEKKKLLLDKIKSLQECKIVFTSDPTATYTKINLNDIVTQKNGKASYTKEYCQQHTGNIPVYSANNSGPIAYMNIADYNGTYLTYSKNGCAGYITIIDGKFSVNGDRCVMTLNQGYEDIDLGYLKYYLQPIFRTNIKGRMGINGKNEYTKLNSTMIKALNIQVPIPIKADGSFDIEKQRELANKQAKTESIKRDLCTSVYNLLDITVTN